MTNTEDGSWSEMCKIGIVSQGGTVINYEAITETVDIDIGNKDFDVINTMAGGRLVKFTPQEPITITFEAYPVEAGTKATSGAGTGFFDLMNTKDTSQPLQVAADRVRNKYRVSILWTDDGSNTGPDASVASGKSGLRIVAADGIFTSVKPSFTDGILKFTITFKIPPFDKDKNANVKIESCDTTAELSALASYTSSTKW